MKTLKIAVIGGGWIGTSHARAINNIKMCYGADIVPELELVVDVFEEPLKKIKDQYGFNRYSTNPDDAFGDPDIDIVYITTPNNLHVEQVQDFTPTPMTKSSAVFYTGMDLKTLKPVYVEREPEQKKRQKSYFFKFDK